MVKAPKSNQDRQNNRNQDSGKKGHEMRLDIHLLNAFLDRHLFIFIQSRGLTKYSDLELEDVSLGRRGEHWSSELQRQLILQVPKPQNMRISKNSDLQSC